MTLNHSLQSPAIEDSLRECRPDACKYFDCTLAFREVLLGITHDLELVHIDGVTGDTVYIPFSSVMVDDIGFDLWGTILFPELANTHYDFRDLEMNG